MRVNALLGRAGSAAVAACALLAACNFGSDISFGSGGGFSGGSSSGTVPGEPTPPGPCESAQVGSGCGRSSLVCEQPGSANAACNAHVSCDGEVWQVEPPVEPACATECPKAYVDELPDGCAVENADTLLCAYPEGTCGCVPVFADAPDAGPADAGDADDAGEGYEDAGHSDAGDSGPAPRAYTWKCVTPEAGCPRTRPLTGAQCVRPLSCDYGACLFEDGVRMRCYSGRWSVEERACDQ